MDAKPADGNGIDVKRIIGLTLLGLAVILAIGINILGPGEDSPPEVLSLWTGPSLSGAVQSLTSTSLTIKSDTGTTTDFEVTPTTVFRTVGTASVVGQTVKVHYKDVKTKKIAVRVATMGKGTATVGNPASGAPADSTNPAGSSSPASSDAPAGEPSASSSNP